MKLKIEGMSCGHCVQSVTSALKGLPGVEQVDVSLERGEATLDGVDSEAAVKAVRDAGYKAVACDQLNFVRPEKSP